MKIEISNAALPVKINPENEIEEIMQNIRMIISVAQGTVPLYRAFGVDADIIDSPVNLAKAKLAAQLAAQISKYEPRAKLKSVQINDDFIGGELKILVTVEV